MASPWVPNFGPVMRGVTAGSSTWSPDGTKLAYVGSFEDGSSVEEVYVFDLASGGSPVKVHADIASPHQGALPRLAWVSESTLLFVSDLNVPSQQEIFAVEASDLEALGMPQSLLSAPSPDMLLSFAPSPDGSALLASSNAETAGRATLVAYFHEDGELIDALEVSDSVAPLDGSFAASAQWFADSQLLAFVEGEGNGMRLSIARLFADGSLCSAVSAPVSGALGSWRWLRNEASAVFSDEGGVHRLGAGATSSDRLSGVLEPGESLVGWAIQPTGFAE